MPILTIVVAMPAPSTSRLRKTERAVDQEHKPISALAGIATSVIQSAGSGRFTAPMKPRKRDEPPGRNDAPGEAEQIARGERGGIRRLPEREQDLFAVQLRKRERNAENERGP